MDNIRMCFPFLPLLVTLPDDDVLLAAVALLPIVFVEAVLFELAVLPFMFRFDN